MNHCMHASYGGAEESGIVYFMHAFFCLRQSSLINGERNTSSGDGEIAWI